MPPPNRRGPSLALMFLLFELYNMSQRHGIPPVTLGTIAAQIVIYLKLIKLPWNSLGDVCISVDSIVNRKKYLRLILSQIEHADDWHLYYNMISFAWKGRTLEQRMGSFKYFISLIVFTLSTAITYVVLNMLLAQATDDSSYMRHCAVGFSGVIFALKVLTTHYDRSGQHYFMGTPIGSKYIVWAELLYIQMISPNASFVGHLAGILVGLAYIYGPLKPFIEFIYALFHPSLNRNYESNRSYRSSQSSRSSSSSPSSPSSPNQRQNQNQNYRYSTRSRSSFYQNYIPTGMTEEEQLRRATEESLRQQNNSQPSAPPMYSQFNPNPNPNLTPPYPTENYNPPPPYPTDDMHPDYETLRRIRLRKYQGDQTAS